MSSVRDLSAAATEMAENWPIISALLGGTAAMRKAAKEFLPQWPAEDGGGYEARLKTATLFPAFARTIEVLSGKPFSKPLTYGDDVPPKIKEYCADVDLQGRSLHVFAAGLTEHALSHGGGGILVDFPRANGVKTRADEAAAGVRPYFVEISAESIIGWRSIQQNGQETLTQLRYVEMVTEEDGPFGEKLIEQVRVLYPGKWETWRLKEQQADTLIKQWILHESGETSIQKIPFVPIYGRRTGFMTSRPPLIELAYLNVEHWQSKSDQQTILHVARVPILFGRMLGDAPISVGASSMVQSEQPDGDLKYVEHTGASIASGRTSLLDLEDQMRQIGAELLVIKPGNTSVAQTNADDKPGSSTLQRIVEDVEDGIDQALQLMAEYVKEATGGHVTIFKDFGATSLAEASADLLLEMNIAGSLSNESLFLEMQRRGLISPDVTWEQEQERIKSQPPKPGVTQTQLKA